MITRYLFVGVVVVVIIQRLLELRISNTNAAKIIEQGGDEHSDNLLGAVKTLQVTWWIAMIAEVWIFNRPFIPLLGITSLILVVLGQLLRYLSMRALEWRWTLTIMTVPGIDAVHSGPYAYIRHPNWLGVILEIAFLPLVHSAYLTSFIFSIANAFLMSKRIQSEEAALTEANNYKSVLMDKPRFLPGL
ncbi:isoprenylcysteine carboxyl methyltransferase family protein [Gloeocapsa sp. PCC 73106]|uniref:isoprenylcysteine carboxyl methyltransferase family protein n=1 Tax=Gloeocapsa sp. PCC 73106 TaxID=102232 RepID=UPI0002AC354B|nr:isoprenylcysteine carboxylmethyltransferase family protein [Gloeocapsa sp. PCC 73106]ELR97094.1 hypothetical protein GLO73106DRAFT_00008980 [Gloeocapsa sp. PCC 73106]